MTKSSISPKSTCFVRLGKLRYRDDNTANHDHCRSSEATSASRTRAFQIAWGLAMCFYFLEYASRSAPAVMIPHLIAGFRHDRGRRQRDSRHLLLHLLASPALSRVRRWIASAQKKLCRLAFSFWRWDVCCSASQPRRRDTPAGCCKARVRLLPLLAQSILRRTAFRRAGWPPP